MNDFSLLYTVDRDCNLDLREDSGDNGVFRKTAQSFISLWELILGRRRRLHDSTMTYQYRQSC